MTNPSNKKRVVTDDDIQVLDAHIAYAKTQADRAAGVVEEFDRATGEFAGVLADIEQSQELALGVAGIKPAYISNSLVQPATGPENESGTWLTEQGRVYANVVNGAWVQTDLKIASVAFLDKRAPVTPRMFVGEDDDQLIQWSTAVAAEGQLRKFGWYGNYSIYEPKTLDFGGVQGVHIDARATLTSLFDDLADILTIKNGKRFDLSGRLIVRGKGQQTNYGTRKNLNAIRIMACARGNIASLVGGFVKGSAVRVDNYNTGLKIGHLIGEYCGSNGLGAQTLTATVASLGLVTGSSGSYSQRQDVTVTAALPGEVVADEWFAVIRGRIHRIVSIDAARTTMTLWSWVDGATVAGDAVTFVGGAALLTTGSDSSNIRVGFVDGFVVGIGHQWNALYGATIGELQTQFNGAGWLAGQTLAGAAVGMSMEKSYYEGNLYDAVLATVYRAPVDMGMAPTFNPAKAFSMVPAVTGGALSTSATAMLGLTYKNEYGLVQGADLNPGGNEPSAGVTVRVQKGNYSVTYNTATFTLADPVDLNRLSGLRAVLIQVMGSGANNAPSGTLTVTPPAGHTINGGAAGASVTFTGHTKPAQIFALYTGNGAWKVSNLSATSGVDLTSAQTVTGSKTFSGATTYFYSGTSNTTNARNAIHILGSTYADGLRIAQLNSDGVTPNTSGGAYFGVTRYGLNSAAEFSAHFAYGLYHNANAGTAGNENWRFSSTNAGYDQMLSPTGYKLRKATGTPLADGTGIVTGWTDLLSVDGSGSITIPGTITSAGQGGVFNPKTYTLATLPAASASTGGLANVSNPAAGKNRLVQSDGTAWRYTDATTV